MEIPDRDQHENEIIALLLEIFESLRQDIKAGRVIPWAGYRQRLQAFLTRKLAGVFMLSAMVWAQEKPDFAIDERVFTTLAIAWAADRAATVIGRWLVRAQAVAAEIVTRILFATGFTVGGGAGAAAAASAGAATAAEVDATIDTIAGESVASGIAITETTAAQSAGQRQAVQTYQVVTNVVITGRWVTEDDEKVCPICRPLDGTTQDVWGLKFPLGPPAHPRCRCHLDF